MKIDCAITPDALVSKEPPAESLKEIIKKTSKSEKASEKSNNALDLTPSEKTVSILVPASLGICYEQAIVDGVKCKIHTMNINGKICKIILGQINEVPDWAAPVLSNYISSVSKIKVAR